MNWSAFLLGQEIRNHASSLFFWKFQLNYALRLLDMWLWLCVTGVISHISFTFSSWGKVSLHIASFSFPLTVRLEHALFCCCFWVNTLFEINTILMWVCRFCVWKLHRVLIVYPVSIWDIQFLMILHLQNVLLCMSMSLSCKNILFIVSSF